MKKFIIFFVICFVLYPHCISKTKIRITHTCTANNVDKPVPAIIVCPGGSYSWLDYETEGTKVAKWLQSQGISAFVLKYRVQGGFSFASGIRFIIRGHQFPDPLEDLRWAISYLRTHADSLNIDKKKIGVMGFSAGGHLSMSAGIFLTDSIERPNFVVPIYPVVTFCNNEITHKRSRRALLGEYRRFSKKWRDSLSLEKHIHNRIPPVFLANCIDDPVVDYRNSVVLDSALTAAGINHEYHQFISGGHGFGADSIKASTECIQWKSFFLKWFNNVVLSDSPIQ